MRIVYCIRCIRFVIIVCFKLYSIFALQALHLKLMQHLLFYVKIFKLFCTFNFSAINKCVHYYNNSIFWYYNVFFVVFLLVCHNVNSNFRRKSGNCGENKFYFDLFYYFTFCAFLKFVDYFQNTIFW